MRKLPWNRKKYTSHLHKCNTAIKHTHVRNSFCWPSPSISNWHCETTTLVCKNTIHMVIWNSICQNCTRTWYQSAHLIPLIYVPNINIILCYGFELSESKKCRLKNALYYIFTKKTKTVASHRITSS